MSKNSAKKTNQKTKALLRIRKYLTQSKADLIFNAYLLSSFNYCPLIWMFCSKQGHALINTTFRRALKATLCTFSLPLSDMLSLSNCVSIHTKNLRLMLIEVYKSLHRLSPEIMQDIFKQKDSKYGLRNGNTLVIPRCKPMFCVNSFDFRAIMAWNNLPAHIKASPSDSAFAHALTHIAIYCRCKLCCHI